MKLLTHNILKSNVKGATTGYPLMLKATQVKIRDVPYSPEFVKNMMPRLEYGVLAAAAAALGFGQLPPTIPQDYEANELFLKSVHHALHNIEVEEGELICPETGRVFPIKNGIPNMLLREDEV